MTSAVFPNIINYGAWLYPVPIVHGNQMKGMVIRLG